MITLELLYTYSGDGEQTGKWITVWVVRSLSATERSSRQWREG